MALFRDLDPGQQAKIEAELIRRESIVRDLTVDIASRGNTLLFIGRLGGAAGGFILAAKHHPVPVLVVASTASFLLGLVLQGVMLCIGNLILWRLNFQLGGYKASVLASQTDVAGLNISATPTKRDKALLVASFFPFLLWTLGASFSVTVLIHPSPLSSTYSQPTANASIPSAAAPVLSSGSASAMPKQPSISSGKETNKQNEPPTWSLSDKIAFWAVVAGTLQAAALLMTLRLMQLSARRQLRAYVFAETFDLFDGATMQPPQPAHINEPGVLLMLKNSGQTPAYNVVSTATIQVIEPIHEARLIAPPLVDKFSANLGPGTSIRNAPWLGRQLTPADVADINSGAKGLYLYGRIEYRDVFKKKRFTAFRLRYVGQYPPTGPAALNFTEAGNQSD